MTETLYYKTQHKSTVETTYFYCILIVLRHFLSYTISCMRCHLGSCVRGIATQKQQLVDRLDIEQTTQNIAGYLEAVATEVAAITLACGKNDVHQLNKGDLVALTLQASAITGLPLAAEAVKA